jgi:hypothetical protein
METCVKTASITLILFAALGCGCSYAQWKEPPSTGSPQYRLEDRTYMAGQSGMGATITAQLEDATENAKHHKIVVRAQPDGVTVQAGQTSAQPNLDEARIQYQLDTQTPENTTSNRWTFAPVSSGAHTVTIRLVDGNNKALAEPATLTIHVP